MAEVPTAEQKSVLSQKGDAPPDRSVAPVPSLTETTKAFQSLGIKDKHPESVPALLTSLYHLRETNPKAVRNTVQVYPAELYSDNGEGSSTGQQRDRRITSWKMTEHMYFKADNVFPTLARGLFTEELEEGDEVPPGLEGVEGREVSEVNGENVEGVEGAGVDVREDGGEGAGPTKKRKIRERIVARGYDKFFNIDEVPWTYVSTALSLPVLG